MFNCACSMGLTQYKNELLKVTTKEIKRFLGGDHRLFTEERKNSSELQNLSSELSFHSSELLFRPSVGKFSFSLSYSKISRERLDVSG